MISVAGSGSDENPSTRVLEGTLPNRSFLVATQYATHGRLVSRRCDCDTFFCTTFSRAVSSSSSFARNTFLHRQKAITFSSKIFQTCCFYFFFCSCCSYFNALARYSTFFFAQLLPPIREPLDLFHFVELPAIVSLAFLYKLLTLSLSLDWGDFAHTVVVAHVLDDEILLYTTQHNSKCRE